MGETISIRKEPFYMSVYTYNSTSGTLERVAGGLLYADTPIGTVQSTFDTTAPTGWLLLQGQTLSRAEWTELFVWASARNLVGAGKPFGDGDGTTTFTLPDLRELVLVGAGQSSNDYDASTNPNGIHAHDVYVVGEFKDDQFQGHSHKTGNYYDGSGLGGYQRSSNPSANLVGEPVERNYGTPRYGSTTHGKQVGVNYIIKARQTAMPLDLAQSFNSLFVCSNAIDAAKTINLPTNFDKSANTIKVVFSNGHNCADSSTPMTLNGTVVCSNQKGTLAPLPIHEMTESNTTVYKCVGANTTLELYWNADYDGQGTAAFVVVGNPLVLSSSTYSIYANGYNEFEIYSSSEVKTNKVWIDGKPIYRRVSTVDHTISRDNWGKLIDDFGCDKIISVGVWISTTKYTRSCNMKIANNEIAIYNSYDAFVSGDLIVFEYTKTTD